MSSNHPPLPDTMPTLVRIADCWTNRRKGRFGWTPYSQKQLRKRIAELGLEVRSLGPRTQCLARDDVRRLLQQTAGAAEWLCVDCGHRWEGADVPATRCPGCGRQIIAANETQHDH